jgi:hypothetical protein
MQINFFQCACYNIKITQLQHKRNTKAIKISNKALFGYGEYLGSSLTVLFFDPNQDYLGFSNPNQNPNITRLADFTVPKLTTNRSKYNQVKIHCLVQNKKQTFGTNQTPQPPKKIKKKKIKKKKKKKRKPNSTI